MKMHMKLKDILGKKPAPSPAAQMGKKKMPEKTPSKQPPMKGKKGY